MVFEICNYLVILMEILECNDRAILSNLETIDRLASLSLDHIDTSMVVDINHFLANIQSNVLTDIA